MVGTESNKSLLSNEPDVTSTRKIVGERLAARKNIIVVAHSYGCIPTCEAVEGFDKQRRIAPRKSGSIVK